MNCLKHIQPDPPIPRELRLVGTGSTPFHCPSNAIMRIAGVRAQA